MIRMRNKSISCCLAFLSVLMFLSCTHKQVNPDEEITGVSYEVYSGERGKSFAVYVSKDSIKRFSYSTGDADSTIQAKKISPAEWEKVKGLFSLSNFKKVDDGKSNAPVDGTDEIFQVYTKTKNYRFTNGMSDYFDYWRISGLTGYLRSFEKGL